MVSFDRGSVYAFSWVFVDFCSGDTQELGLGYNIEGRDFGVLFGNLSRENRIMY